MKSILILVMSAIVISSAFTALYGLMEDCLNPPTWIKVPRTDFKYCSGLLMKGIIKDYPTLQEYRDSKAENTEQIPVNVTEPDKTNEIVISGKVNQNQDKPVTILIKDQNNNVIHVSQIIPDASGRFIHTIQKQGELWENVTEYVVEAR